MSTGEDANGDTGERGKERQVMFMNPATSVVRPQQSFYPYGEKKQRGQRSQHIALHDSIYQLVGFAKQLNKAA